MKEVRFKRHILNYTIANKLWKSQIIGREQVNGFEGQRVGRGVECREAQEGSLWDDETLPCLDFDGSYKNGITERVNFTVCKFLK